ncbi:hypothetical protein HPG69_005321, partial [Diceros bicornis minor]
SPPNTGRLSGTRKEGCPSTGKFWNCTSPRRRVWNKLEKLKKYDCGLPPQYPGLHKIITTK